MATEEFKVLSVELFDNYVLLRQKMESKGYGNVNLSYKEYFEFYLKFRDLGLEDEFENLDYDDDEDEDLQSSEN